jgi:hypothetical protein
VEQGAGLWCCGNAGPDLYTGVQGPEHEPSGDDLDAMKAQWVISGGLWLDPMQFVQYVIDPGSVDFNVELVAVAASATKELDFVIGTASCCC